MVDEPALGTEPKNPMNTNTDPETVPLSGFVKGVLTLHFVSGHSVSRSMSQHDARKFNDIQRHHQNSEEIPWDATRWLTWESERIECTTFDADKDQNWELTSEERRTLRESGHSSVVDSLVQLWKGKERTNEPTYSVDAIALLHELALQGAERDIWNATAEAIEGTRGAALFTDNTTKTIYPSGDHRSTRHAPLDHHDDNGEPNKPSSTPSRGRDQARKSDDNPARTSETKPPHSAADTSPPITPPPKNGDTSPEPDPSA